VATKEKLLNLFSRVSELLGASLFMGIVALRVENQALGDGSPGKASNCERLTRSRCAV
jgi:hypothetical protein